MPTAQPAQPGLPPPPADAAAAIFVKLSMTGAIQTVPATTGPALMRLRRENCEPIRLLSQLPQRPHEWTEDRARMAEGIESLTDGCAGTDTHSAPRRQRADDYRPGPPV